MAADKIRYVKYTQKYKIKNRNVMKCDIVMHWVYAMASTAVRYLLRDVDCTGECGRHYRNYNYN